MADVEKPKSPIMKILGLVGKIQIGLVMFTTVILNMMVVYILFFPDEMPKPFYVMYTLPTPVPTIEGTSEEGSTTPEEGGTSEVVKPGETSEGHSTGEYLPGTGVMLDTGTKIVNLAEPGGRKFIRCNVVVEFAITDPEYEKLAGEKKTEFMNELKVEMNTQLPIINDTIITILSTKDFQAVYTAEGKEALRADILNTIKARLPEFYIINIYFTEFVMQ
jgi:flagellar FliL protein